MKIAICDDKSDQISIIKTALEEYCSTRKDLFAEIDTFDKAFDFLDAQEKVGYQIVLLDICMPGMLGTDVAKEIREKHDKIEIIFLTTSDEFAVEAFEVKAVHYLLKPFTQLQFDEAMDRAIQNIGKTRIRSISLKCLGGAIEVVDKDVISYIESASHRQMVYLARRQTVETVETLWELFKVLEEISPGQFISPYKGFIVNQQAIAKIENDKIILKSGKEIPMSRRNFRQIKQTFFDYMFKRRG